MDSRLDAAEPATESAEGGWLGHVLVNLLLVAFVGYLIYRRADFGAVALVACGLGLLIFIHELGHFLAAKWCDVYVETFSIGFGPALPYCSFRRGETLYKIAVFPLGGYVKMLGEGSDGEEGEDDPRSFKNKTVGQRMLIISAGVIMNLILAVVAFVGVYMTSGIERPAGVVGTVIAGSPAWIHGLKSGAQLTDLGGRSHPYFDDIRPVVLLAEPGSPVVVRFTHPDFPGRVFEEAIAPMFDNETRGVQLIGVAPAYVPVLLRGGPRPMVAVPDTPAAAVADRLRPGDRIVATTDPAKPEQLAALPDDPRADSPDRLDFFAYHQRLVDLAGKPMALRFERPAAWDGGPPAETIDVVVPPAFHRSIGMVMRLGAVAAVRQNSPVSGQVMPGDKLKAVEVGRDDGSRLRFVTAKTAAAGPVDEQLLDPVRLPFELRQWANRQTGPKRVKLTLLRSDGHDERKELEVVADWDDRWNYAIESSVDRAAPMAIPGLGLAYYVETAVEEVIAGSPAAIAGVLPGDVILAVRPSSKSLIDEAPIPEKWMELKSTHWASAWSVMQDRATSPTAIGLKLKRGGDAAPIEVALKNLPIDPTWPAIERGLVYQPDIRLQRANGPLDAIGIGFRRTWEMTLNTVASLKALATGRISFTKNTTGPIGIAAAAYGVAAENVPRFVIILAMLSINLAVINFLPIPVLDGGHMVFLLYEKIVGRPAPEAVRVAATFAGLAIIAGLFLCVTFLDVMRTWF